MSGAFFKDINTNIAYTKRTKLALLTRERRTEKSVKEVCNAIFVLISLLSLLSSSQFKMCKCTLYT